MRYATHTMQFTRREIVDLLKAWIAISIAFAIFFLRSGFAQGEIVLLFLISLVTAGIGFIVHELCHKVAASRFRVHGEFHSNDLMLVVAVLLSFMGIIFAAPGAVYLSGSLTRKENGIISVAGPASNLVLALLFLPLWVLGTGPWGVAGYLGFLINSYLGLFNMIPFLGLDGQKVLRWSKPVYFTVLVIAALMVAAGYAL